MKKILLSVMLLSGVIVFAQETKKEVKKVEKTEQITTITPEKS